MTQTVIYQFSLEPEVYDNDCEQYPASSVELISTRHICFTPLPRAGRASERKFVERIIVISLDLSAAITHFRNSKAKLRDNINCINKCFHSLQLAWHPKKEGSLSFGTDDGKVGIYDVFSNK